MLFLDTLRRLCHGPVRLLLVRWNWKSAVFSSGIRAAIFFTANLQSGLRAAEGAMLAELAYRTVTAGFYGALTQGFSEVEPAWAGAVGAMVVLPLVSHSIELAVHALRGTPHLKASLIASVCFTIISTLFNLYAMRRGALIVGSAARSAGSDLKQVPRLIAGFLMCGPAAVYKWAERSKRATA